MTVHVKWILFCALTIMATGLGWTTGTLAHHGWGWATDEEFTITGRISAVRLGNPHGEVDMDVEGKVWVVEVGQPWRNARAGLSEDRLAAGTIMTVHGHRSANPDVRLVKAERVVIAGQDYDLYPDRES